MKRILFVCNHNAGRSQMAEAFFNHYASADVRAESAGSHPGNVVWPEVVEVMREVGFDLGDRRPRRLELEMQLHADWAVTMGCGDACPYVPTTVEDWDVPDPAGRPIEEVRMIRDGLEARVRDLVDTRLDAIRTDMTAHQLRLKRLLPKLEEEFGDQHDAAEIRACADAVLHEFQDAPVRSFVMSLAHRLTRECLRRDVCDLLSV
jgi:arsenate reductase (thioredoxin)